MAREYNVWGGLTIQIIDGKTAQCRTIIATKTKKRAIELLGMNQHEFNNWWCDTGNEVELKVALAKPETIFIAPNAMSKDFQELVLLDSGG